MLVAYGWGVCGLLCFDDLFVGMFDNCLMFVVMIVYVWLGFSCGLFGVIWLLFRCLMLFCCVNVCGCFVCVL